MPYFGLRKPLRSITEINAPITSDCLTRLESYISLKMRTEVSDVWFQQDGATCTRRHHGTMITNFFIRALLVDNVNDV